MIDQVTKSTKDSLIQVSMINVDVDKASKITS